MAGLGSCDRCKGPLCVRSPKGKALVACERCGQEVPGHPLAAAPLPPPPRPAEVPADQNAATIFDRVLALEKKAKAQGEELAALRAQLARAGLKKGG